MGSDATERFGSRAGNYAKARPSYPPALFDYLARDFGLAAGQSAADTGSGTGIFAGLLLDRGLEVYAVEPNGPMRLEAERALGTRPGFHSCDARAEATGLPVASVDWVTAAQAFHWFDPETFRAEARRILKPSGCCALVWNERQTDTSEFAGAYEQFLGEWSVDYDQVKAAYENPGHIARVLGPDYARRAFPHAQDLDLENFRARHQSASYVPSTDTPRGRDMMRALDALYAKYERNGVVRFDYHANLYCARIPDTAQQART